MEVVKRKSVAFLIVVITKNEIGFLDDQFYGKKTPTIIGKKIHTNRYL